MALLIVLFYLDENNEVVGYLCCQQQGYFQTREVADFFLKDFLRCKLTENKVSQTFTLVIP